MTTSQILTPDNLGGDIVSGDSVSGDTVSRTGGKRETATQEATRLKRATSEEAGGRNELAWLLVLDNLVYAADAESRWLAHIGTRLAQGATRPSAMRTRDQVGLPGQRSKERVSR